MKILFENITTGAIYTISRGFGAKLPNIKRAGASVQVLRDRGFDIRNYRGFGAKSPYPFAI